MSTRASRNALIRSIVDQTNARMLLAEALVARSFHALVAAEKELVAVQTNEGHIYGGDPDVLAKVNMALADIVASGIARRAA